jgi:hypothetical protein
MMMSGANRRALSNADVRPPTTPPSAQGQDDKKAALPPITLAPPGYQSFLHSFLCSCLVCLSMPISDTLLVLNCSLVRMFH